MPFRVATFNCENLFSRAKILNFNDTTAEAQEANKALTAAQQLRNILNKNSFTNADKAKIVDLIKQGKGFFTVEEDKGKLLSGNHVVAQGRDDFVAHIRFTIRDVSEEATNNTGKVIKSLNADIMCVVEVENRDTLGHFNSQVLTTKRFDHHMLIDGNDDRGIDVGILSNLPYRTIRSHVDDKDGNSKIFSRDCAEYEVALGNGQFAWVLCNHFKSKGFGSQVTNNLRRRLQATRVGQILKDNFDLAHDRVIVAGDLNDTPDSAPLQPLMSVPNLHNVIDTLPADQRFTHIFGNEKSQIDYLLVSTPLRNTLQSVTIERRGMAKFPGHFPSVDKESHAASDHAAVVAEFGS